MRSPATVLILAALAACKGEDTDTTDTGEPREDLADLFSPEVTTVALEIDYAPGAEPYAGGLADASWELFLDNADALFGGTKTLDVPTQLAEMSEITVDDPGPYDVSTLLDISDAHRDQGDTADSRTFHVVWLDGYLADDNGGENRGVLGVSIGDTGVIAMFKPVIEDSSLIDGVRRFSEQLVLTHEFGHAVGLVNNGVPLTAEHHDAAHGAHCANDRCVMYWALEGPTEIAAFAQDFLTTGSRVVFDDDCLGDVAALRE